MSESNVAVIKRAISSDDKTAVREEVRSVMVSVLSLLLTDFSQNDVQYSVGENTTIYKIKVIQTDFGRLLGAKGQNISSLRTLVSGMAAKQGFRAIVQIENEDEFFNSRS